MAEISGRAHRKMRRILRRTRSLGHRNAEILEGDCLDVIARARDRARAPFDLVYVDPPFNAGGTRSARDGTGERVRGKAAYDDAWGGLDRFLAMLEPRLEAMRDALAESGTLWVHLDFRAVHDTKVALDRLFGRKAFCGEIIWVPGNGGRKKNGPSVTHQTILVYARGASLIWNADEPVLRERFAATSLRMHFRSVDADGRQFRERTLGGKTYRYYADAGRRIGSVWTDCPAMNANTPLTSETTGYPTQKPLSLLDRIVRAATPPKGIVLDPMCGSGTTVVAALRAGRRAIGIDQSPVACAVAKKRLASEAAKRTP